MTAPAKDPAATWVGRSIRRLEDPALVSGRGRFTGDFPAAYWVRFVRSAVAAGRIEAGIDVLKDEKALEAFRTAKGRLARLLPAYGR